MKRIFFDGTKASVQEVDKPPHLDSGCVCIQVLAFSIDQSDVGPFYTKLGKFFEYPSKHDYIGRDFSGVIVTVGDRVSRLKVGDEVFGLLRNPLFERTGCEYFIVEESVCAIKPSNLTHEEAVSLVADSMAAERALKLVKANNSDSMLITGGTLNISRCLIQLAGSSMFECIEWIACTVDKLSERSYVESLGASESFDTTCNQGRWSIPFSEGSNRKSYDIVVDTIGDSKRCKLLLNRDSGRYVSMVDKVTPWEILDYAKRANIELKGRYKMLLGSKNFGPLLTGCTGRINITNGRYFSPIATGECEILERLAVLMEAGELTPMVEKIFGIEQISKAIEMVHKGWRSFKGRIVIRVCTS
jgi:NADPH:quinone reductase-like Zn-dependent oxidoreductase